MLSSYCNSVTLNLYSARKFLIYRAAVAQHGRAADSNDLREQSFEAEAVNPSVVGSSPTGGATTLLFL